MRMVQVLVKVVSVAVLTAFVSSAWGQGTPAQINEPRGDQPFGSYQVGDIDQIGVATGSVDVRIPLLSHQGRGITHQRFWTYTSKSWFPYSPPPCDSSVLQCPPPDPSFWQYADNTRTFSSVELDKSGCGDGHLKRENANYTYVDQTGTPHVFDVVTSSTTPVQAQCTHLKPIGHALDGSGMMIDVTDFAHPVVTLKDGTKVQGDDSGIPSFLYKDPNGNMITVDGNPATGAVNGEIDSLGRDFQHVITSLPNNASYEDWVAKDANGNNQQTRIEWIQLPASTNFQQGAVLESGPSMKVASKIDLPNGRAYQFTYDTGTTPGHYNELLRIDLPSGGYIRYEYGPISTSFSIYLVYRCVKKRVVSVDGNPANERAWIYSYEIETPDFSHNTTTVTDPDGNDTAHVTINTLLASGSPAPLETEARYYQGPASANHVLRTVRTDYDAMNVFVGDSDDSASTVRTLSRPIRVTTILDNGLTTKVETDYDPLPDTNGVISFNRSNVTERREYDYDGSLLRRTTYTYLHNANSAYAAANIVDKVLNTTVYDGANHMVAQTQNVYDGSSLTNTNTSGNCQIPSGAPNHDYCAFGTGNLLRGNVTSVKIWRNTDSTWLTTNISYDDLGNAISSTDPAGHPTTFSYSDSWSGASCVTPGVNTYAFLTQTTNALNLRTQASYYSCPGLVQSKRDENDIVAGRQGSTFTYDGMNRLLIAHYADGGQTSFDYHGDTLPITVTKTQLATPNPSIISSVIYDGLGRVKTTSVDSDPLGADLVDTTYDNLGRKATVSNPHRAAAGPTDGITTHQYDALGRLTQVAGPDGTPPTVGSVCLTNNFCNQYSGNATTVTDQAGKQRRSISDALGRLTEVDEVGSGIAGQGSVVISGGEQWYVDCGPDFEGPCTTVYDSGTVTIAVNAFSKSVPYFQGINGPSTPSSLANALANAFQSDSASPVSAAASGDTITFAAKTNGASTNYSLSSNIVPNDPTHFTPPSFAASNSGSSLTGGANSFTYTTLYTYDALSNLTCVEQHGDATTGTGCPATPPGPTDPPVQPDPNNPWRRRLFAYDSISRLRWASNPESGVISYAYDADGNLLQKTSPLPNQTSSATQTISYCYDELRRVTGKAYSAQTCQGTQLPPGTAVVSYVYDSGANAKGHLTSMTDQAGTATYTYDIMGRLATEMRPIAGVSKSTTYAYNLDGSIKTLTYPSNRIVTYTADSAGRLFSAVDGNGTNYVTSARYNPDGSLSGLLNGSTPALNQSFQYTPRLQLCRITALTSGTLPTSCTDSQHIGNVMDRGYNFNYGAGDNGNVISITNYRDANRSQAFTYDALNRLASGWSSANTGAYSWGENYTIDAWGNLQISPMGGKAHGGNFTLGGNAQNRPTSLNYDAAGNLLSYLTANYTYDQENRLSSTTGITYTYDGNGERVLKSQTSNGAPVKRYWSMGGNTLAEADSSGNLTAEYAYFGSKRIARIDLPANTVHYYLSDHLGSTSIVANASGAVEEESDYYPFGTEVVITGPGVNELKFTGKRRDLESQLDFFGARYYGSNTGRFLSIDPIHFQAEMLRDPQRFNLYVYARDNPLGYVDPTGEAIELTGDDEERKKQLAAWQALVGGGAAGQYLYDNTYTDANGNTGHYLGIYGNGPDGKGPAFEKINDVTNALSGIVNDSRIGQLDLKSAGSIVNNGPYIEYKIGPFKERSGATPGITFYNGQDNRWHFVVLDKGPYGTLPAEIKMSDGKPGKLNRNIIIGHEALGHGFSSESDQRAVELENKVRTLKNPQAPQRMEHDPLE